MPELSEMTNEELEKRANFWENMFQIAAVKTRLLNLDIKVGLEGYTKKILNKNHLK